MRLAILALLLTVSLFAAELAGTYKGTYSGSGATGDIRMTLSKTDSGDWKAEVSFTFSGEEVKTKVTSIKVDGSKVKIVYQYDLQGNALESAVSGELKDTTLEGSYEAKSSADGSPVDSGTWKVSLVP